MQSPVFIKINDDIFNVSKIQSIQYEDQKNCLGKDSGVYILRIYMENNIGTIHKAYSSKKQRDDDFMKASKQLSKFSITKANQKTKEERMGDTNE